MKHIALIGLFVFFLYAVAGCSKGTPATQDNPPANPPIDTTRNGGSTGKDSTGSSGGNGNNGGSTNTPTGITRIEGMQGASLFYTAPPNHGLFSCNTETIEGIYLRLKLSDTGAIRVKLVNWEQAMTVKLEYAYLTGSVYSVSFPNINTYTAASYGKVPDTTGKLQLWVYRSDGKDLVPKQGAQPAINKLIQVMGTLPANIIGQGTITLSDFIRPQSHITRAFIDSTFMHSRWTLYKYSP